MEVKNMNHSCPRFIKCSANLCPIDPDLTIRTWSQGEDICSNPEFKELPWIRRQKKLNKRRPGDLEGKILCVKYLEATAPVKRVLSDEQRAKAIERLAQYRKTKLECDFLPGE